MTDEGANTNDPGAIRDAQRNVRYYPIYAITYNVFAWMPIFFLYFAQHVSLPNVLRLEAIYYAAIMALEVPSGYFSDRVGRRVTLLISAISLLLAYSLFILGSGFAAFAVAQGLLAAGLAFNSGTDASFHYDSLITLGRSREFDQREARVARNGLLATAGGGLLGGLLGVADLRLAYAVSLAAALGSLLIITFRFSEPARHERHTLPPGFVQQLGECVGYLRQPVLLWVFAYYVVMTVINHVPYEFYQPYLGILFGSESSIAGHSAPLATGLHIATAMLIGAYFASNSIRLRDRLGLPATLLAATALQTIIIGAMGLVLHWALIALILLRSVPRALMTAPVNAAIAPRIDQNQRATYLSVQSLAGRLAFAIALLGFASLGGTGAPTYPAVAVVLNAASLLALGALSVLAVAAFFVFKSARAET